MYYMVEIRRQRDALAEPMAQFRTWLDDQHSTSNPVFCGRGWPTRPDRLVAATSAQLEAAFSHGSVIARFETASVGFAPSSKASASRSCSLACSISRAFNTGVVTFASSRRKRAASRSWNSRNSDLLITIRPTKRKGRNLC